MPPAGFETTFPAGERPQTYTWDRGATGIGCLMFTYEKKFVLSDLKQDFPERTSKANFP